MLRARATADVQLMIPLVTQVEEVERTRGLIAEETERLRREGTPVGENLPLGIMVETPAAVMMMDRLMELSDFVSVGTNDLTQYTLVVDRGNARLAERFTSFHPAVVRSLKAVVDAAARMGKEAAVCGEMASEPAGAYLLLGLGYRVLSTSPPRLPMVRWLVRQVNLAHAARTAQAALEARTTREVQEVLDAAVAEHLDARVLDARPLPSSRPRTTLKS
jgi:phosphotransferase system enzyme I (PtsI)